MSIGEITRGRPGSSWHSAAPAEVAGGIGRDLVFLVAVALYIVVVGQNWGVYAAALMIAAYRTAFRRVAGAPRGPGESAGGARRAGAPGSRGPREPKPGGASSRALQRSYVPANRVRKRTATEAVLRAPGRSRPPGPGSTRDDGVLRGPGRGMDPE